MNPRECCRVHNKAFVWACARPIESGLVQRDQAALEHDEVFDGGRESAEHGHSRMPRHDYDALLGERGP